MNKHLLIITCLALFGCSKNEDGKGNSSSPTPLPSNPVSLQVNHLEKTLIIFKQDKGYSLSLILLTLMKKS